MSASPVEEAITSEEEAQLLDSIGKWLARDVKP